jgi:hypothetical protein
MLRGMNQHQLDLGFALKPNCLITRRPVLFLTPPRSLFYYKDPWGWVSHILTEHGYKVSVFQIPFQNTKNQKIILEKNMTSLQKNHLFVDAVTFNNLKDVLENIEHSTLTVISEKNINNSKIYTFQPVDRIFSLSYFLHQKWCSILGLNTPEYSEILNRCTEKSWHKLLDHCVKLAEIDFHNAP